MLSDEMPFTSSHIVGKDQRNFGTTNKNKYRVHAVNPLGKKGWFFVELLASFPWLQGDLPHTAHTVAERVVLCRGAWFWNKILQDAMAENLDKQ